MEARSRSFEPVRLGIINVENGPERFDEDNSHRTPAVAFWRVNLTALSQRHNLYFVGTRDRVQVYKPDFPYQVLGDKPALTIIPQLSKPDADGYIDPSRPHDINHLIVGDLGHQEILLLSTDSGNVVAYNTSSIDAATKQDAYIFSTDANADFVGLRPFFSQWVYESAWGLAIHKEGRMIAVSANTPENVNDSDVSSKITVFAFALTPSIQSTITSNNDAEVDVNLQGDLSSEWKLWSTSGYKNILDTPKRDCNYKIVLAGMNGHTNNVPCVTFVNGAEDRTGSWLLSTDITGQMKLWQIWKGKCMKTWSFSHQTSIPWTTSSENGWLVAALDINAFRPAEDMETFIGHHRARQYYGYQASGDSYDLTDVVQRYTPLVSAVYPALEDIGRPLSDEDEEEDEFNTNMDESEHEVPDSPPRNARSALANSSASQISTRQSNAVPYDDDDMILVDSDDDDDVETEFYEQFTDDGMQFELTQDLSDEAAEGVASGENDNYRSAESSMSATSSLSDNQRNSDESENLQENDETVNYGFLTPPLSSPRKRKLKPKSRSVVYNTQPEERVRIPLIPIIHCSTSHVRLLSGPIANYPHIFCARMLRQTLPVDVEQRHISLMDRINMLHQIPELGIVLIATQLGRCAVCSLTKRKQDGLLGFRVDWILPTKRQERSGARPHLRPLLGIASSPIQGHVAPENRAGSSKTINHNWSDDRVINGTLTTFDPNVVMLDASSATIQRSSEASLNSNLPKRISLSFCNSHTERREWTEASPIEQWKAHESSRRYRVMLTYLDMTVLTYEISRGVEREDIAVQ